MTPQERTAMDGAAIALANLTGYQSPGKTPPANEFSHAIKALTSLRAALEAAQPLPPVEPDNLTIAYMSGFADGKKAVQTGQSATAAQQKDAAGAVEKDAKRYRFLREQDWFDSELCVLRNPKMVLTRGIGLGADCPSLERLDVFIDAAIAQPVQPAAIVRKVVL